MTDLVELVTIDEDEQIYGSGGVYSAPSNPLLLPKYHPGNGWETFQTQARMYVPLPTESAFTAFQAALSERARAFARAISIVTEPEVKRLGYFDFFLQRANEAYQEKRQVSEVLSDGYVAYYYGQRAPVWSFTGAVLNTRHDQWYDAFHVLYEDVLRGTRLADLGLAVRIAYDTRTVIGSLDSMSTSLSAGNELFAPFQFQVLVQKVIYGPTRVSPTIVRSDEQRADGSRVLTGAFSPLVEPGVASTMAATVDGAREGDAEINAFLSSIRPGVSPAEIAARLGLEEARFVAAVEAAEKPLGESLDSLDPFGEARGFNDEDGEGTDLLQIQRGASAASFRGKDISFKDFINEPVY